MEDYQINDIKSNLQSYLNSNGIDTIHLFKCINPHHQDSNASMKLFNDNKIYCFGCGASYDLISAIGAIENIDNKEAFKKAIQYYGSRTAEISKTEIVKPKQKENSELKDYSKAFKVWHYNFKTSEKAKNYLLSRGISEETAIRFRTGFNKFKFGDKEFEAVIIPINSNSFTARNTDVSSDFRYYKPKECPTEIFNKSALINDQPCCVITEGEFDCLSFDTIGLNAIALGGANNVNKFIKAPKSPNKAYILALDNDSAGIQATENLIQYFKENKIKHSIFTNLGYKDANKALMSDRNAFEIEINKIKNKLTKKLLEEEMS